jgi:flagellar motility protein MotE (MotC chaperone)
MSLVQEIIREAKQETRLELKKHSKRLLITLGIVASLMSVTFYIFGVPYHDSVYRQMPLFAGIPTLAMASFNAFGMTTIVMFFLKALGVVTCSTIKNNLEQRKKTEIRKNSRAIYDAFNAYGQKDYSFQIDEAKQGLQHQIDKLRQENAQLKSEIKILKEERKESETIVADKFQGNNKIEDSKP